MNCRRRERVISNFDDDCHFLSITNFMKQKQRLHQRVLELASILLNLGKPEKVTKGQLSDQGPTDKEVLEIDGTGGGYYERFPGLSGGVRPLPGIVSPATYPGETPPGTLSNGAQRR